MNNVPTRKCVTSKLAYWVTSLFAFLLAAISCHAAEPSLISIDDLYRFDAPQGLVVSPDGGSGVYSRRWVERSSRSVRFSLWQVDGDAAKRQPREVGEPDARSPIFSPDGKWIVFLSTRPLPDGQPACEPVPPYSDPATDLWLIPTAGGKAIPLAGRSKPYGRVLNDPFYGHVSFSPDSKRLVFVADDGVDPRTPDERANNVQIVREDQGEGYEGYRPAQIWIADLLDQPTDVAAARVTRITNDDVWYGDPQWLPDGKSLIVHANRTADRESVRFSINRNFDLWRIELSGSGASPIRQLTFDVGPDVSPRLAPDGQRLIYLSVPRQGSHADVFNLMVLDLTTGGVSSRVLFDHHGANADKPPHLPPAFPLPRDCWLTGEKIFFTAPHRTGSQTQVLDLSHGPAALTESNLETHSPAQAKLASAKRKLTPPSDPFLTDRVIAKGELVSWKSFDGQAIEGILTRPTTPGAKPPFKMVLYPHGGPHSRSSLGFDFTVQVFAANGYAVFQPNFRGSAGYGQRFVDADRADLGGGDMQDIFTGIEHLVRENLVDARRQFVYGISYGGYTTCSLIGQTHQFRAAAPQNAVTDLNAMWGLSDIQSWTEWEFDGLPWEVPDLMRDHSPLTFASRIKTPTLILHAANDRRCPLPMGRMFYRALKANGVKTEMVIYPDEGHGIKQPAHQEDVLRRVLDWFIKHDVTRSEFSASMNRLKTGMSEAQVLAHLGSPDDVRTQHDPGGIGFLAKEETKEIWRYGTSGHLTPATLGQVFISENGQVQDVVGIGQPHTDGLFEEDELRSLLTALGRDTSDHRSWDYNPRHIIEVVNRLQPLGKHKALAVIREYLRVTEPFLDSRGVVFLVLRTLFDIPNEVGYMPPMGVGAPNPSNHDDLKLLPRFPIALEGDIPFFVTEGFNLGGLAEQPEQHVAYFEKHGTLRSQPLSPSIEPFRILDEFAKSPRWNYRHKLFDEARGRRFLGEQVLKLRDSVIQVEPDDWGYRLPFGKQNDERCRNTVAEASKLEIRWHGPSHKYVFPNGASLAPIMPKLYRHETWKPDVKGLELSLSIERDGPRRVHVGLGQGYEPGERPVATIELFDIANEKKALVKFRTLSSKERSSGYRGIGRTMTLDEGQECRARLRIDDEVFLSPIFKP